MKGFNWIPQLESNNTSINSTNRMKTRLLTKLKLKYMYQQKKIILKEWCYSLEYKNHIH